MPEPTTAASPAATPAKKHEKHEATMKLSLSEIRATPQRNNPRTTHRLVFDSHPPRADNCHVEIDCDDEATKGLVPGDEFTLQLTKS